MGYATANPTYEESMVSALLSVNQTYISEILKDTTIYEVCVVSLGNNWKQALVFLAIKFNFSTQEVFKFKNPGEVLCTSNALEVFQNRKN